MTIRNICCPRSPWRGAVVGWRGGGAQQAGTRSGYGQGWDYMGDGDGSVKGSKHGMHLQTPPRPLCDIPSGCSPFTGPWTVTRSSLRMLRRVAAFCRPLQPVLLLVLFPFVEPSIVLGLCWMWHGVPFARQRRPVIGILRLCWLLLGVV